jgi:hypothetical protein
MPTSRGIRALAPALAGIEFQYFESNDVLSFPGIPEGRLCVAIDGAAYDYFVVEPYGTTWYFRVPQPGATPVVVGFDTHEEPRADWLPRFEKCEAELQKAAYPLSV